MTGKDILDKTFEITFQPGNYARQLKPLDVQGMVGRTQTLSIIMDLLEELDKTQERIKNLENENLTRRSGQDPNTSI